MSTEAIAALADADVAAIKRMADVHGQALVDHDPAAFMATCADDITFMPPNEEPLTGQAACQVWLEGFPRATSFAVNVEEVDGCGDLAVAHGDAVGTMEDGTLSTFKFLSIWRKQSDGSWRMARDMWSLNHPPA